MWVSNAREGCALFRGCLNLMFPKPGALKCDKYMFHPICGKQDKLPNVLLHFSKKLNERNGEIIFLCGYVVFEILMTA